MNVNFSAMAKEIANLLDQKESVEQTRGDGKIEGSIWAKYSGKDEADNISQDDAEKVIASDLKEKGVDFMRGLLHGMGIEWNPPQEDKHKPKIWGPIVPMPKQPAFTEEQKQKIKDELDKMKKNVKLVGEHIQKTLPKFTIGPLADPALLEQIQELVKKGETEAAKRLIDEQ